MEIIHYKQTKDVSPEALHTLFLKEQWNDYFYPEEVELHINTALHLVTAYVGEKLIGYGRLAGDGSTWVEITDVLVKSEYQGKGIGTEITRRLVEYIKTLDVYHIHVEPISDREVHLYGKFGFTGYQTYWMELPSEKLKRRCAEVRGETVTADPKQSLRVEDSSPFKELRHMEQREILPKCHVRFVHSDNMTFSYWNLEEGAEIPEHSHPHEQVCSMIEGRMELTVGGETRLVSDGSVIVIASNTPHSVKALTPCYVIDVFYPIREDYRESDIDMPATE